MLEIGRGRHVKPQKLPLEQRICQRCTSNSVDDEIHFLFTSSNFATQRTSLLAESKLNSEFDSLSNDDKFIYIMSSTHRPLVICLAKYTYTLIAEIIHAVGGTLLWYQRLVRLVIPLIILVFRADVSQCMFYIVFLTCSM